MTVITQVRSVIAYMHFVGAHKGAFILFAFIGAVLLVQFHSAANRYLPLRPLYSALAGSVQPGAWSGGNASEPIALGDVSHNVRTIDAILRADGRQYSNPLEALRARGVKVTLLSRSRVPPRNTTESLPSGNFTSPTRPFLVPNLVHYVWFEPNRTFKFTHYLSFVSVQRYLAPEKIFLHGDALPIGPWWERTVSEVDNLYSVYKKMPRKAPNGLALRFVAHASDMARMDSLVEHGGIYLDGDIFVLKSFDELRRYPFVLGRETSGQLCNGIIISERAAPFLSLWMESYKSYMGPTEIWAYRSTIVPHELASVYPHLVHVEQTSLHRPNWASPEVHQLYTGHYDWSKNYAIHVWQRTNPVPPPQNPQDLHRLNTTLGEISRHVLYGSKALPR